MLERNNRPSWVSTLTAEQVSWYIFFAERGDVQQNQSDRTFFVSISFFA
jgi:hypothetical protein